MRRLVPRLAWGTPLTKRSRADRAVPLPLPRRTKQHPGRARSRCPDPPCAPAPPRANSAALVQRDSGDALEAVGSWQGLFHGGEPGRLRGSPRPHRPCSHRHGAGRRSPKPAPRGLGAQLARHSAVPGRSPIEPDPRQAAIAGLIDGSRRDDAVARVGRFAPVQKTSVVRSPRTTALRRRTSAPGLRMYSKEGWTLHHGASRAR